MEKQQLEESIRDGGTDFSVAASSTVAGSLDGLQNKFSEEYKEKLNDIVFAKLT